MIAAALLAFALAALGLAWAEDRLHRHTHAPLAVAWVDRFLLPLGRVFALLLFIAIAYPALFGRHPLPALRAVVFGVDGRADTLINVLFLAGLLLPALPLLRRAPGLTLPLQGMAGVALLFSWVAQARGLDASLWPDSAQWLLLGALAGLASAAAGLLTLTIDEPVLRQDARDAILLWLQAPLLLVYARMLGPQLSG